MNEERINELKNALRQVVQLITARGQPLNEDLRALLVQVMEHVAQRIQQLRAEESPVEGLQPQQEELQQSMPSSNISRFKYDPENEKLFVQFLGKHPDPNGPIYSYEGVPQQIFELFQKGAVPARTNGKNKWGSWWKGKVPSMGASMYTLLKSAAYPYQRLS
jgi:KTSC domain-containing protein